MERVTNTSKGIRIIKEIEIVFREHMKPRLACMGATVKCTDPSFSHYQNQ
jgi:hypothetical protein